MTKKIKNFIWDETKKVDDVEKEVNEFTRTHNVIDIKISGVANKYGFIFAYVVVYEE